MKKPRRNIGGDIYWNAGLESEADMEAIRDKEICKVLRKIGVLSVSPIGSVLQKGYRWRLNLAKIMEILAKDDENVQIGTNLSP